MRAILELRSPVEAGESFPGYGALSERAIAGIVERIGSQLRKTDVLFLAMALSDETLPQLWGRLYTAARGS